MIDKNLQVIKKIIPSTVFNFFQPIYHYKLALFSAILFRFPSKQVKVIGVTGTKGKSTTTEMINAILEEAGYKTAVSNTIRYKVADKSTENKFKMSMPGRFFVQRFIRRAVNEKCDYVILEMTSQGVLQFRHKFIDLDALVFTNLSPEHIESHGSYENYRDAKLKIAEQLSKSSKRPRIIVANADDKEGEKFLAYDAEIKKAFSIRKENVEIPLPGEFNKYNALAAITLSRALGVNEEIIQNAIKNFKEVKGRLEKIEAGQNFTVIVDYAHTPDSLQKVYDTFKDSRKICVLGGTGGGRDSWKRKEMGRIADEHCDEIILTNEDPYDEDPEQIIKDVAEGVVNKKPKIIMDRREAICKALHLASKNDTVLITGKGTDPYIMGANGSKIPWSDARVAKEEIEKLLKSL